jgi:hypothetical protein
MTRKIKQYPWVSAMGGMALLLVLAGPIWLLIALAGSRTSLVVHFNDLQGITALGGSGTFIFMGIFGILVVLINVAFSFELESRHSFFGKVVAAGTLGFAILLFIACAAILSVN